LQDILAVATILLAVGAFIVGTVILQSVYLKSYGHSTGFSGIRPHSAHEPS